MAFIELHGVTKTYGSGAGAVTAVDSIDLAIEQGEFTLIVGPSGAGKTTVLNILGGMEQPCAGSVLVNGRDIALLDETGLTQYRRHEVGFVFQFYNLVASLTARENVELAAELNDRSLPAEEVLADVGLAHRMDNFPAELSGGEQQRVAIARALAKNPALILADEPTGALDFETGRAVLALLQRVCRESGTTLVLITHNLAFEAIADRVVRIANGRVVEQRSNPAPASAETLVW